MRAWVLASAVALAGIGAAGPVHAATISESFEDGLAPWRKAADITRPWEVDRLEGLAENGGWSVELTLDGRSDAGTVWIVREVRLDPGIWDIDVDFELYSESEGLFGRFDVVAAIALGEPQTLADFTHVGTTNNVVGWKNYQHSETLNVGARTTAWIAVGVDVIFEDIRTYPIDSVTISGIPLQCGDGECAGGETACSCPADCSGPPSSPSESNCTDGLDDDCDGFVDCDDAACEDLTVCRQRCDNDGVCEINESCFWCPADCPEESPGMCCGDGNCSFIDPSFCMWDCAVEPCDNQRDCPDAAFCDGVEFCRFGHCDVIFPCLGQSCHEPSRSCVAPGATPGEAGTLTVDAFDAQTGQMTISWQPACAASDHNIVFGPLSSVSSYGYSGQDCGIGTSGSYDQFDPGSGSVFFLIVGTDGASQEGSYGLDGSGAERPEQTTDPVCAYVQTLAQRCD